MNQVLFPLANSAKSVQLRSRAQLLALAVTVWLLSGCALIRTQSVTFEGTSMLPGIKDGDQLLISTFARGADFALQRSDIILFRDPNDPAKLSIKRLIALPGETVEIRGGKVILDGRVLEESFISPRLNASTRSEPPLLVPVHQYYVLADNRDNASDSRIWGCVPQKNILGKVIAR